MWEIQVRDIFSLTNIVSDVLPLLFFFNQVITDINICE